MPAAASLVPLVLISATVTVSSSLEDLTLKDSPAQKCRKSQLSDSGPVHCAHGGSSVSCKVHLQRTNSSLIWYVCSFTGTKVRRHNITCINSAGLSVCEPLLLTPCIYIQAVPTHVPVLLAHGRGPVFHSLSSNYHDYIMQKYCNGRKC